MNNTLHIEYQFFESSNKQIVVSEIDKKWIQGIYNGEQVYYHVTCKSSESLLALTQNLSKSVIGNYLMITMHDEISFCAVIDMKWLTIKTNVANLNVVVRKVLDIWLNGTEPVERLYRRFTQKYKLDANPYFIECIFFYQLLDQLSIAIKLFSEDSVYNQAQSKENERVIAVAEWSIQNLLNTPTVIKMSKEAGMSISKFTILFVEILGKSPHRYVLDFKMEYAKTLLLSGQYTVTQVAYKVGYQHVSGFSRIYKSTFGHSPVSTQIEDE